MTGAGHGGCKEKGLRAWRVLIRARERFLLIDGSQRAAAFAFYAFFSLFPLILLFVAAGSLFVDRNRAARDVITFVEGYVPLGSVMERNVFNLISGVVRSRTQAGLVALSVLFWGALRFFTALVRAVSRAWGTEVHNWWQMPVKDALLLAVMTSALLLGINLPVLTEIVRKRILPDAKFAIWICRLAGFMVSVLVLFYMLSLFYKLAPRRATRVGEIWAVALIISVLVRILEAVFVSYVKNFGRFSVLYGALGGVMALLMWMYLSGCLFVFGACLCAAVADPKQPELRNRLTKGNWTDKN